LNLRDTIQHRFGESDWITVASPDTQMADIQFSIPIPVNRTQAIHIRAIDTRIGVTSPTMTLPVNISSVADTHNPSGLAFADNTDPDIPGDLELSIDEEGFPGVQIVITPVNANAVRRGIVEPDDFAEDTIPFNGDVTLTSDDVNRLPGDPTDILALEGPSSTGNFAFASWNGLGGGYNTRFGRGRSLRATFVEPVSVVSIDAIERGGSNAADGSYARIAAFDSDGNLIARASSGLIPDDGTTTLRIEDTQSRIASIVVGGHADTFVGLDNLRYGPNLSVTTNETGLFAFDPLPDGIYDVDVQIDSILFDDGFIPGTQAIVSNGVVTAYRTGDQETSIPAIEIPISRIPSQRQNQDNVYDVDRLNGVQPLDALLVIRDMSVNGIRRLTDGADSLIKVDVSGDGLVSPVDALLVINELSRLARDGENTSYDARIDGFFSGANALDNLLNDLDDGENNDQGSVVF
ncbi:MAG: dockerin type I domain-containing protein, partial [Planctomycetota bacterium]